MCKGNEFDSKDSQSSYITQHCIGLHGWPYVSHIKIFLDNHSRLYADPPFNESSMSKPFVAGLSFVNQIHDFNDFT